MNLQAWRLLLFLALLPLLPGCAISTKVSAIGLRAQSARLDIAPGKSTYTASLQESKYVSEGFSVDTFPIPYVSLVKGPKTRLLQSVEIQPSAIAWKERTGSRTQGQIDITVGHATYPFEADGRALRLVSAPSSTTAPDVIFLERKYRRWYGYPAQVLLPVAMAADFVTGTVFVLVVAPTYHLARAVSPGP